MPSWIGIDPWFINPLFNGCKGWTFISARAKKRWPVVDQMLGKIAAEKYREQDRRKPFVIVKADAGTYGMGIMSVKTPVRRLARNRKQRNKMAVIKGRPGRSARVIVQEGRLHLRAGQRRGRAGGIYDRPLWWAAFTELHTGRGLTKTLNARACLCAAVV